MVGAGFGRAGKAAAGGAAGDSSGPAADGGGERLRGRAEGWRGAGWSGRRLNCRGIPGLLAPGPLGSVVVSRFISDIRLSADIPFQNKN